MDYTAAKLFIFKKLENELPSNLTYHGLHHTQDVLQITEELCDFENVSDYEALLIKTACLFHDTGFLTSIIEHEKHSCEIAKKHLPRFGYSNNEIKRICRMIMATKIPQSPKNNLEEILCDADLDYLGRDDFFPVGKTLFKELKNLGMIEDELTWNKMQIKFLENHSFFTPTNIERRTNKKLAHLQQLKSNPTSGKKSSDSNNY